MSESGKQVLFEEFLPEDFDAYLPEKWNSNMFTLPRRKVKGKLEAIGGHLKDELDNAGLSLVMYLSDEFPSLWNKKSVDTQWLFFSRDEAARAEIADLIDTDRTLADTLADPTPRYRHIFIGVAIDQDHFEIGMRLHHDAWVDRRNLIDLTKEKQNQSKLLELLENLPEHYEIGLEGNDTMSSPNMGQADFVNLVNDFDNNKGLLFLGARLPRDQVLVLGADIIDTVHEIFQHLIPVYRFIAWSPDNDAISMDQLMAERNVALKASHEELEKERAERGAKRREQEIMGVKLREEIEDRIRKTDSWRQREIAARRTAAVRAASPAKSEDPRAKAEALAAKMGLGGEKSHVSAKATEEEKKRDVSSKALSKSAPSPNQSHRPPHPQGKRSQPKRQHHSTGGRSDRSRSSLDVVKVTPERAANIQTGDLVEVKKGFLQGRRGQVQEIDEKGGIRVNFGALSSRLIQDDVSGLGPLSLDQQKKNASFKRSNKEFKAPRQRFRGKLSNTGKEGSQSQQKNETRESSRSREGK